MKTASGHEYYASLRTETAIERAEVAVLVIDGSQSVSEQDMRIIQTVRDSGRALVIAFNKWDLVDEERRYYLEREIERDLVQVQWAPRVNITARTGWHVDRLVPALEKALEGWETRITTGQLNAFLGRLVAEHPHPVRGGKQPKVLFGTQATTSPPDLRAVHQRQAGRRLRALHRAAPARGVRLRRHPDLAAGAPAREAEALRAERGDASYEMAVPVTKTYDVPGWGSAAVTYRAYMSRIRLGVPGSSWRRCCPQGRRSRVPASAATSTVPRVGNCSVFPADNWWNREISTMPVHARSSQWLSQMSTEREPAPRLRPVVR